MSENTISCESFRDSLKAASTISFRLIILLRTIRNASQIIKQNPFEGIGEILRHQRIAGPRFQIV